MQAECPSDDQNRLKAAAVLASRRRSQDFTRAVAVADQQPGGTFDIETDQAAMGFVEQRSNQSVSWKRVRIKATCRMKPHCACCTTYWHAALQISPTVLKQIELTIACEVTIAEVQGVHLQRDGCADLVCHGGAEPGPQASVGRCALFGVCPTRHSCWQIVWLA